jgi:hypothetical protein
LAHDAALAIAHDPQGTRAAFLLGCAAIARSDRSMLDDAVRRLSAHPDAAPLAAALTAVFANSP